MSVLDVPLTVSAHTRQFFVGGEWVSPQAVTVRQLVEPATHDLLGEAVVAGAEDAPAAVAAARGALPVWSALSGAERADALERVADVWERRASELGALISREMGMPVGMSTFVNGTGPVFMLRSYAAQARIHRFEERRPGVAFAGETIVRRRPVGVVAAIAPWNFAGTLLASKFAPALAAGCTVVLKPAEENALSARIIGEIFEEAALPAGTVNVLPGGPGFSSALVSHHGVDRVAFTGSTTVGRIIGGVVGERLGTVNLELGGKSAAIVLDDADLDLVGTRLAELAFMNSGQTCFAQTRIVATPGIYSDVVARLAAYARAQVLGNPLDPATTMGPLATVAQVERAHLMTADAVADGARLAAGGPDVAVPATGNFVAPTVLTDVDNDSPIAQHEVFGPVVVVIRARDAEDALRLANASAYGLAGSVWSRDVATATALAARFEAGSVGVNGYTPDPGAPWGGVKSSGQGRENGVEALESYLRPDVIYVFDDADTDS